MRLRQRKGRPLLLTRISKPGYLNIRCKYGTIVSEVLIVPEMYVRYR